jgi:hypothetical protein
MSKHVHSPNYKYTTDRIEWRAGRYLHFTNITDDLKNYQCNDPILIIESVCTECGCKYLVEERIPEKFSKYIEGANDFIKKRTPKGPTGSMRRLGPGRPG